MAFAADGEGDHGPRRLVLLPAAQGQPSGSGEDWELADLGSSQEVAATARTRRNHELVVLVEVSVPSHAPAGTTQCLVQQLVAALRRTNASLVSSSLADEAVRRELLAVGFVPLPLEGDERTGASGGVGERLILQL